MGLRETAQRLANKAFTKIAGNVTVQLKLYIFVSELETGIDISRTANEFIIDALFSSDQRQEGLVELESDDVSQPVKVFFSTIQLVNVSAPVPSENDKFEITGASGYVPAKLLNKRFNITAVSYGDEAQATINLYGSAVK